MLAVVVAALLWGTTGAVASFVPEAVGPVAIGATTMGVGGVLLALTGGGRVVAAFRAPGARRWIAIGAAGVVVYPLAFYSGMDLAGVAIGNVVALGTGPVIAAILERVIDGAPLGVRWLASTSLAVAGVAVLATSKPSTEGGSPVVGVLLALLAGVAYGLYTYSSGKAITAGAPSRGVMGAMFGLAALVLLPVLVVTGAPVLASVETIVPLVYLVVGPTLVAYLLIGVALVRLRSSTVTTIALLEPVAATVLAVVVVGERLSVAGWCGIGLILLGIGVLVTARPPRSRPQAALDSEP